ncbi:aminotransferase class I/II-fold pyridoxal phosphate-dependent enzyme [Actinokineospora inagensis]|uniref:aminotransferase class I/II-fold pyridoxal phosphate-dependent enzyme n=1 Tax=Actinokineospora inagensis TaxID=103730 RepID=UPI0003F94998|nr:aminotransferase class I/II-fold pyridoxal phosphate-dependent enzyme [Actinokineospora inagensis]
MVSRAAARMAAATPAIAAAHFQAEADPYHPSHNPDGFINLGTAENRLLWDLLEPAITAPRRRTAADTHYGLPHGDPGLRSAIAGVLTRRWRGPVDPDDLVVAAGGTAALDIAATTLCDPGDVIIVPAPYYSAFAEDLTARSGARIMPVPMSESDGFALDADLLARAVVRLRRDGHTVRAVAISSPANPHGLVHTPESLRDLLRMTTRHDLDLISDEVYAHCAFGPRPFRSALDPSIVDGFDAERVHVVWGFAKDFGLSGLKVGVLRAGSAIRPAARALAYFATVSADTQALLRDLLTDDALVARLVTENNRRLAASYEHLAARLTTHRIPHLPATAGFSIWTDLRTTLPEPTVDAETALWQAILRAKVNVLPGTSFGAAEPGWFRVCFAQAPDQVGLGVDRLAAAVAPVVTR